MCSKGFAPRDKVGFSAHGGKGCPDEGCTNSLWGNDGNDTINGGAGTDSLFGDAGNDNLNGGDGNDSVNGGSGDDTINGSLGTDTLAGSSGNDRYMYNNGNNTVVEAANEGTDTVETSNSSVILWANVEHLLMTGSAALNGAGHALNNSMTGNSGSNTLWGDAGNDSLSSGAGNDTLYGGIGNDTLNGGAGQDALYGEAGTDRFRFSSLGDSVDAARDKINDFTAGTDKIDVIGLGFTGVQAGAGSGAIIGYTYDAASNLTYVSDADSTFSFQMVGHMILSGNDFIFS